MSITSKENIQQIFEIFEKANPNPTTELIYQNDFTLLIAILLSAQTTDKMVNKATEDLFQRIDSPSKMLELGLFNLEKAINCLNFYKTKAKNIIKACEILLQEFNSIIPYEFEELIKLPGVGRKTANVFLGIMKKDEKRIGIDTHLIRLSLRLGFVECNKNLVKVEEELIKIIPENFFHNAHHWLILHGRYICKAKKPLCETCPISHLCPSYKIKN